MAVVDRAVNAVYALGATLGRAFQWDGQIVGRNTGAVDIFSGVGAPTASYPTSQPRTGAVYYRQDGGHASALYQYDGSTWAVVAGSAIVAPFAVPSIALGTAAAAGASGSVIRADATILAFDATVPVTQAYSDAAATGAATVAARRDHRHGMPAAGGASGGTPALVLGTANAAGSAGTFIRDDDTILAFDATAPTTSAIADAAAVGAATVTARRDHVHGREDLGQSNSQPAGNETIMANYCAEIIGLPYVIPNGFVTSIAAGGVLVLTP